MTLKIAKMMRTHLFPMMMITVCIILGANYPSEEVYSSEQQMEKSGIMVASDRGHLISSEASSQSNGISNTRSNNRRSNQHSNNDHKRISNIRDTIRPATSVSERPKPKSITNKPNTPAKPQEPIEDKPEPPKQEEPSKPTQPSKPEPEPQQPEPVYLVSLNTPIVKAEVLPTEKKKPIIKVEVKKNELLMRDRRRPRTFAQSDARKENAKHTRYRGNIRKSIQSSSSKPTQRRVEKMRIQNAHGSSNRLRHTIGNKNRTGQ